MILPPSSSNEELLTALLDLSLAGAACYTALLDEAGQVVDFDFVYVNPAAQRLLGIPAQPAVTYLQQFPESLASGVFAAHRAAFLSDEPTQFDMSYPVGAVATAYRAVGRRQGQQLLVSFTPTEMPAPSAIEDALRASQAREQAAHAEAERQRGELQRIFEQAPVAIAVYRGPQHVIELANPLVCALWGRTQAQAMGTPLFELLPEIIGQGYEELLAGVMTTGEPYVAKEMPSTIDRNGQRDMVYWNFVYLPVRAEDGAVTGVMVVATEVSEQVKARQQVQHLNDELAIANQALHTSNAELLANQEEVLLVQQQLELVNQQLEARGLARTQEARAAQAMAENQRQRLVRLIEEAPAGICMLDGPELVFELVNPGYQALFPGRQLLGKPVLEAMPELVGQPVPAMLRGVYETGVTFEGREVLMRFARPSDGVLEERYFNFIYQARYNEAGHIDGLVVFAFEITEQVRTHQQTEALQAQMLAKFSSLPNQSQDAAKD